MRCIAREGFEGSSMRRVAAEAGVSQPLLLHHFGSRSGLIEAVVRYAMSQFDEILSLQVEHADYDIGELLENLFGDRLAEVAARHDTLFLDLQAAAARDESIREIVAGVYARFQRDLAGTLRKVYPDATAAEARRVSYGLLALCESHQMFREIQLPGRRDRDAIEMARALVATLGDPR